MSRAEYAAYAPSFRDGPGFGPAEPMDEESGRGPLLLGISVAVLLALIGIIWISYKQGVREGGRDAPPRIAASVDPYKVEPDDPGGVETAHLGIEVFGLLEDPPSAIAGAEQAVDFVADAGEGVESTAAAEPALPPQAGDRAAANIAEPSPPTRLPVAPPAAPGDDGVAVLDSQAEAVEPAAEPLSETPAESDIGAEVSARAARSPADAGSEAASPAAPPALSPGRYFVQVASFRNQSAAALGWDEFRAEFSDLLGGRPPNVARADLGDRGVRYRLRVSGFPNREDASVFCDALKARDQECLVVGS